MKYAALQRYRDIVDDFPALLDALERPLPVTGWVNPLKSTAEELFARFDAAGVAYRRLPWKQDAFCLTGADRMNPGRRIEYLLGHYQIQEEAAMLPVALFDLAPGARVADLCAAPGNKTAQIAVLLRNTGTVLANDRSPTRMRAIRNTLDRLGIVNVVMSNHDAANFHTPSKRYDGVLADVPCSCEGTSRKNGTALNDAVADTVERVGRSQRAILERAFRICRPGGTVVYATCTYAPEENEEVIADVLERIPFAPEWIDCKLPGFVASPGITQWNGREIDPQMSHAIRVWPHQNDTGGFFVAAWTKPESW